MSGGLVIGRKDGAHYVEHPPRTEWTCITCRTRWSQAGWVHVRLLCSRCVPPFYASDLVYPLDERGDREQA